MNDEPRASAQISEALDVLRKHWTWILACVAVACAASAAWTWTRPLVFEASSLIAVEPGANPLINDRSQAFETHRYLLKSRPLLENVAEELGLENPAGAEYLDGRLSIEHIPDTHILRITAQASTAERAMNIANELSDQYVLADAKRRVQSSERLLEWLQAQMVDIKGQVETSELALIEYVETANLDLVDMAPKVDTGTEDLRGSPVLADLHLALGQAELRLEYALLDFTDEHPTVVRLRKEIAILQKRVQAERARVTDENKKRIRYEMLERDAQLNREMFAVFTRELKRVNLMGDDPVDRIQVQETATLPSRAIAPNRAQNLVLGALIGLLLGVALAFLHETLDRTLRRPDEIEKATGLPILATIHRKQMAKGQDRFLVRPDGGWGRELEDFRALRTSLRFARAEGENRVIEVTSPLPQEGKTTIVTNLAMVMGQAGERVLIVDADLRRPAVHSALSMENEHGLTNLLAEGDRDPLSLVRATEFPNVFVITAGARAPNPPELLESPGMKKALEAWREEFDRVVIDTPPVSSVVDPRILAPLVDGVALLVSTGRADADTVRNARAELDQVGAKFFGVIVNQLARGGDAYYGYHYYYSSRDEDDEDDRARASG